MSRYRLNWYDLSEADSGDWLLKVPLGFAYTPIIDDAFPDLHHIGWRDGSKSTLYTLIKDFGGVTVDALRQFLDLLKSVLVLRLNKNLEGVFSSELDQCFALDFNLQDPNTRTGAGTLEYAAKYQRDNEATDKLAELLSLFCGEHPCYARVDRIAAVPGNPEKTFHLPDLLVEKIGARLKRQVGLELRKSQATPALKNLRLEDKLGAISAVFELHDDVSDQSVLLVDDLYQSGTTMWTLAKFLKERGVTKVYGLTCVKSWRDSDNV